MRLLLLAALAATVPACTPPPQPADHAGEMRLLSWLAPEAVLDSVAVWAAAEDDVLAEPDSGMLVVRRRGTNDLVVVEAWPRDGGVTEVLVSSRYALRGSSSDPAAQMYTSGAFGPGPGDRQTVAIPAASPPGCFSRAAWIANGPPTPEPPAAPRVRPPGETVEEIPPVLVGGLSGLAGRVVFPPELVGQRVGGVVLVQFVVTETGAVECPGAVISPHPRLAEAAVEAVAASRFEPGTQQGRPVRIRFTVPITFSQ